MSVSITLLILALLGFLSFGIGLGIAVGLFVIGTGSTGFGSKSFDNDEVDELMKRDPKTYTKSEKVLYGWRDPIKEHIEKFAQTDRPELENNLSQKR